MFARRVRRHRQVGEAKRCRASRRKGRAAVVRPNEGRWQPTAQHAAGSIQALPCAEIERRRGIKVRMCYAQTEERHRSREDRIIGDEGIYGQGRRKEECYKE